MSEPEQRAAAPGAGPQSRWVLIRDLLVFQLKLLLDGARDILLSPVSLVAGVLDLISSRERPGRFFYDVVHLGKRSEAWINLFEAADRVEPPEVPTIGAEANRVDAVFDKIERAVVDQYQRGGMTAQAKDALDRLLDGVHGKAAVRAAPTTPTVTRLDAALRRIPQALRAEHVAETKLIRLPANVPPWTGTGIELSKGAAFSLFAEGRVILSEEAGLWNGPRMHLWSRVGGRGPLLNGTRDTASFEAPTDGELELCIYSGEWGSRDGELATPTDGYAALTGGLDVLVVCWKGDARAGIEALARSAPDEAVFQAERARLAAPVPVPPGWHYLWFLGPADIFRPADGHGGIRAETRDDVGILQRPVDLPFGPDTVLGWRWKLDALPSPRAENTMPTHDYLSIAVEFENGQDLTYYWSAELDVGTHYRCPLPNWDTRETHWVVRSGSGGLGAWHEEQRPLHRDYEAAVGTPPGRIVAVWLIAVSVFQKGSGAADFADIWLETNGQRVSVLGS